MDNPYEAIQEEHLAELEQDLRIKLPTDYRQFLLAHNGGRPTPFVFDVNVDGLVIHIPIDRFLGIRQGDLYSFSRVLEDYKGRLPSNLLPIACEALGLECISINGEDYGKIYFWDQSFEVTEGEPDYSNVYLIAHNFSEFLDMLHD
jgi:hypothetical protein